ncbi:Hint domain-containing protein [Roseovarius salis]|uniref:Hint domain-containing protein n=1 Tax=Roseovarius salis TaxID=3376063 RepID=UPI0037C6F091
MKPAFVRHGSESPLQKDAFGDAGIGGPSRIMTLDGLRRVDTLRPGDRVVTRDTGVAVLRAARRRRTRGQAVRITAGTLGHGRPDRDTLLPSGQPVLVRDWRAKALFGAPQALVSARRLVDGTFATLIDDATITVHDLEFDGPHVLYVDGLELASSLGAVASP